MKCLETNLLRNFMRYPEIQSGCVCSGVYVCVGVVVVYAKINPKRYQTRQDDTKRTEWISKNESPQCMLFFLCPFLNRILPIRFDYESFNYSNYQLIQTKRTCNQCLLFVFQFFFFRTHSHTLRITEKKKELRLNLEFFGICWNSIKRVERMKREKSKLTNRIQFSEITEIVLNWNISNVNRWTCSMPQSLH